jgi:sugar phosphate isomerase/epimerase
MSSVNHQDIRIGTMAGMDLGPSYLAQMLPHGFECFELTLWQYKGKVDLAECAKASLDTLGDKAIVSSVGIYGNPLQDEQTRADWAELIKAARLFGTNVVCGFAGAQEDRPVDENMVRYKEVWGPLAKLAEDEGVRIAWENCDMGGNWNRPAWNIAHSPAAWEMMFDAVPSMALGLEWEPCHQMGSMIDPIPQLRKWVDRVYHVHGKDATIHWDVLKTSGLRGGKEWHHHRTPGFGDSNWTDIITILRMGGFQGAIDIEGWHDPIYRGDLETTGQVHALNYLKQCRGGAFVPNPS